MTLEKCKIEKISVKQSGFSLQGVIAIKVNINPDEVSEITSLLEGEANISLEKYEDPQMKFE